MRRRRSKVRAGVSTFGLSFLDLLSCAFGSVIILAVIVSASAAQRGQVESFVALIDVELRSESGESLAGYPLSLTLLAPGARVGTWQGRDVIVPLSMDYARTSSVALCVPDERCTSRHMTITGQGIRPGRYRIDVFSPESASEALIDAPLSIDVAVYFDGRRLGVPDSHRAFTLRQLDSQTLWSSVLEFSQ